MTEKCNCTFKNVASGASGSAILLLFWRRSGASFVCKNEMIFKVNKQAADTQTQAEH